MSSSPKLLIQALVASSKTNPQLLNELITARDAALLDLLNPGAGNTLEESNRNGVSYKMLVGLPEDMRITVLSKAIYYIETGSTVSSISVGTFN